MSDLEHIYKANLRPVTVSTLPDDIRAWRYVHEPGTLDGGRYGVVALPRALDADDRDRFGFTPADPGPHDEAPEPRM